MNLVAVANLSANSFVANFEASGVGIWFTKSFEKKFQSSGYPSTLNIATKLEESMPSLRNFKPIPGARG
jgi:hypothetical protein